MRLYLIGGERYLIEAIIRREEFQEPPFIIERLIFNQHRAYFEQRDNSRNTEEPMFKYHLFIWWMFPALAILLTACNSKQSIAPTENPANIPEANIPNPASAYCEVQGGKVEIREGEAGQYGICIFPDGSGCDEWALFHGVCTQGAKDTTLLEGITASYVNLNYGFTLIPSEAWTIDDRVDSLVLKHPGYCFFVGFKPIGQALPLCRTGMPAGEFVDGGEF